MELRPHTAGSDLLELRVVDPTDRPLAWVVFASIADRRGRSILSVRDQHTDPHLRRRRLMTLVQLFLIHRYGATSVHYLSPTDDNAAQVDRMREIGLYAEVTPEIGHIIVAAVDPGRVAALVAADRIALNALIEASPTPLVPA